MNIDMFGSAARPADPASGRGASPNVSGFYGWMLAARGLGGLCGSPLAGRFGRIHTGTPYIAVMVVEALV